MQNLLSLLPKEDILVRNKTVTDTVQEEMAMFEGVHEGSIYYTKRWPTSISKTFPMWSVRCPEGTQ